jgi:hypothetical protein
MVEPSGECRSLRVMTIPGGETVSMDTTRSRRTGALIASAALLASLTVATVAAPASAGKCEPYDFDAVEAATDGCFYATEPITDRPTVLAGVVLNGSSGDDSVARVFGTFNGGEGDDTVAILNRGTFNGGEGDDIVTNMYSDATFNGGSGNDVVQFDVKPRGTFNGGPGNDAAKRVDGTFNGGSGDDYADFVRGGDSTFNGGSGNDCTVTVLPFATFAGGGGTDGYVSIISGPVTIWSADEVDACEDIQG